MTNVNKMRIQLKKINGGKPVSSITSVQCKVSVSEKYPNLDLSIFSIEQICQQAPCTTRNR